MVTAAQDERRCPCGFRSHQGQRAERDESNGSRTDQEPGAPHAFAEGLLPLLLVQSPFENQTLRLTCISASAIHRAPLCRLSWGRTDSHRWAGPRDREQSVLNASLVRSHEHGERRVPFTCVTQTGVVSPGTPRSPRCARRDVKSVTG